MAPGDAPDAESVIVALGLAPHPEGGWYAEVYRSPAAPGGRGALSTIYYLLGAGERSHWHRIDATEVWHHYDGDALELSSWAEGAELEVVRLGSAIDRGEQPQAVVPPRIWQAATPLGAWSLVGCTVAPAFEFAGFELASPDWAPPGR